MNTFSNACAVAFLGFFALLFCLPSIIKAGIAAATAMGAN
jgi:hypothetical protein